MEGRHYHQKTVGCIVIGASWKVIVVWLDPAEKLLWWETIPTPIPPMIIDMVVASLTIANVGKPPVETSDVMEHIFEACDLLHPRDGCFLLSNRCTVQEQLKFGREADSLAFFCHGGAVIFGDTIPQWSSSVCCSLN